MNWEAIGAVGEVVGAIGVIATLGYLAVQIRQNSNVVRSSTRQAISTTQMDSRRATQPGFRATTITPRGNSGTGSSIRSSAGTNPENVALSNKASFPISGTYVSVLEEGSVTVNDTFELVEPSEYGLTVAQLFNLYYTQNKDQQLLKLAVNNEALPEHKRVKLAAFINL